MVEHARVRYMRALGSLGVALAMAWGAVLAYAVHPALPYNPVRLPYSEAINLFMVAPQGWGFFTKSPRLPREHLFRREWRRWVSAQLAPHSRLANVLGLRRRSRAQGVEMALLAHAAPDAAWRDCTGELGACLDTLPAGYVVKNTSPTPTLCGPVAVVLQKAVPWAWSRARPAVHMPARILPLEARC